MDHLPAFPMLADMIVGALHELDFYPTVTAVFFIARETEDGTPQAFRMDRGAEPVSLGDATPDQLEIAELRWSPIIQTLRDGVEPRW